MNQTAIIEEQLFIKTFDGKLEAILSYPESEEPKGGLLIVPPHPGLGGNFDNNIVLALAQNFSNHGFATLRFNYRGIGNSTGGLSVTERIIQFNHEPNLNQTSDADTKDILSAFRFFTDALPNSKQLYLAGYSYGAALLFYFFAQYPDLTPKVAKTFLISPPLQQCELEILHNPIKNTYLICAEEDLALTTSDLEKLTWLKDESILTMNQSDHFYIGQEQIIADHILNRIEIKSILL